ncbi:hypothetical protein ZIOFF_057737 [Zingiber officinale]|uniref:Methyltransferase n=1 Tax=Zingiber officinale TaxID=94328 RepID=A0A8J5KIP9_ZINOF|nr:hypothetical protein ZIOFF_057737 [Zingiber officinale]
MEVDDDNRDAADEEGSGDSGGEEEVNIKWEVCKCGKTFQASDYIPYLDNWKAIKKLKSQQHIEHREQHCPKPILRCLVSLPWRYKVSVPWPKSRDMPSMGEGTQGVLDVGCGVASFGGYLRDRCSLCIVHWDADATCGKPRELNRILRPGGFFVWLTTHVYR